MTSVKNAATMIRRRVTVIISGVGAPLSREPVRLASHTKAHLTGKSMNNTKAAPVRRIHRAARPEDALVSATARASRIYST